MPVLALDGRLMKHVIVVGGGYAGVSAATALAEQGHRVDLLESRGSLGGRVYSIPPSENFPASLDNGPHLFMGCYRETFALLERLGERDAFHWIDPLGLDWLSPGGKTLSLKTPPLPAPFHLAFGLFTTNAFPWREKFGLARALLCFSHRPFSLPEGAATLAQFLDLTGQGPESRTVFWNPLCSAVMNVPPQEASLSGMGEVLHRIFFGSRKDSAFAIAAKPLGEIAFPMVPGYLERRGGSVHRGEGIQSFETGSGGFRLVSRTGRSFTGDSLIWAVPPSSLASLWPAGTWDRAKDWPLLGKSPILTVNLILDRRVLQGHFLGLAGARFEWVFNRNANWGWEEGGQYLSFTASAAADLAGRMDRELADLALGELAERCYPAQAAKVLHAKVTREMAATFHWTKATDPFRPPCQTPWKNVFLAGDWTNTGLPATIEGACLSGRLAAEKVQGEATWIP